MLIVVVAAELIMEAIAISVFTSSTCRDGGKRSIKLCRCISGGCGGRGSSTTSDNNRKNSSISSTSISFIITSKGM